jgi:hypothetical protein
LSQSKLFCIGEYLQIRQVSFLAIIIAPGLITPQWILPWVKTISPLDTNYCSKLACFIADTHSSRVYYLWARPLPNFSMLHSKLVT